VGVQRAREKILFVEKNFLVKRKKVALAGPVCNFLRGFILLIHYFFLKKNTSVQLWIGW
jgi:hypothetical protein